MADWISMKLGELCPFVYGKSLPSTTRNEAGSISVFGSNGVVGKHNEACVFEPGVIVGRKGSVGEVHFSPTSFWPIDTAFYVVGNPKCDVRFAYYLLKSLDLKTMNSDSAVPGLNRDAAHSLVINVPPLREQMAIVDVLGALDDKIESNRRLIDLLIVLARTMLLYGSTHVRLGDVAECDKGLSYKGSGLTDDPSLGIPMINLANFGIDGWLNAQKLKFYNGEYKERHVLQSGDLVVANTDLTQQRVIIGRPALVPPNIGRPLFTHHVTAIRPIEDKQLNLPIWAQLNSPAFRERAEGFATGTTVAGMPVEALLDFEISIPATDLIEEANELLERVWAAESENIALSSLRDSLLPELLSGRLRVKDAESIVENV